jgi:hypothetical protein
MNIYEEADLKTITDLNTDKQTTKHDLMLLPDLQGSIPCSVDENYLTVVFTVPTGVGHPTVQDICGIHLVDYAQVVLAELSLEGTIIGGFAADTRKYNDIHDLINQMMAVFTDKTYLVTMESVRWGEAKPEQLKVVANHPMQAIAIALNELIDEVYGDVPDTWHPDSIDSLLKHSMSAGVKTVVTLSQDKRYSVMSVEALKEDMPTAPQSLPASISFKVSIDQLLAMPNLMDHIQTDEGVSESDVRGQLIKWKNEGLEFIPS